MHIVIMRIEKNHKMPRLFVVTALIVAVSGVICYHDMAKAASD